MDAEQLAADLRRDFDPDLLVQAMSQAKNYSDIVQQYVETTTKDFVQQIGKQL